MKIFDITEEYLNHAHPNEGNIITDNDYHESNHQDEIIIANWLLETFGGTIMLRKESLSPGEKTSDYIWNVKQWELKSPLSINTIDDIIRRGMKQINTNPGGIIIHFKNVEIDLETLNEKIERRFQRSNIKSMDVIIIHNQSLLNVTRFQK